MNISTDTCIHSYKYIFKVLASGRVFQKRQWSIPKWSMIFYIASAEAKNLLLDIPSPSLSGCNKNKLNNTIGQIVNILMLFIVQENKDVKT